MGVQSGGGVQSGASTLYWMILINLAPYCDCDMHDENLHLSVGRMTCDKGWVSSAGCDRQLKDPWNDHGNLSSVTMAESIDN